MISFESLWTGLRWLTGLSVVTLLLLGCGAGEPSVDRWSERVAESRFGVLEPDSEASSETPMAELLFAGKPRLDTVTAGYEGRPAVVVPAGRSSWRVRVPDDGWLQVGVADPKGGPIPQSIVSLTSGASREILGVTGSAPGADGEPSKGWRDLGIDLSAWAGKTVTIEFDGRGADGGAVAWGPVALSRRTVTAPVDGPPNVVLIVVDTLRADHLQSYGYERETSPEIERWLAAPGTVAEDAYSQAPWTLPSVVSYLTSHYPGEVLGDNMAAFGVPEALPTLAETFQEAGYETAAFIGNPTLHAGNGFARGFDTFYGPDSLASIALHADSINRRALPWIAAHRDRPFALYLHYVDPHDPYENPDLIDGRSPFFPEYEGPIRGSWMHGIYNGHLKMTDPENDIRHLTALYDSEIRYVDRAIGQLMASVGPELLENTLFVLTADHGEELFDHGGWKHGHTLYEDQINVPLIVRWDGRVTAGRRLSGTIRLLDLAPTLAAAAGIDPPTVWRGENLLPTLLGEQPLPRLTAFAQHLGFGPTRAASVLDGKKLILFNRQQEFEPVGQLQKHIYAVDMGRLELAELYDVDGDPGEVENLISLDSPDSPDGSEVVAERTPLLSELVYRRLDDSLTGLRLLTDSLAAGSVLSGEIVFDAAPGKIEPLFLDDEDSWRLDGRRLSFRLVGTAAAAGLDKGLLIKPAGAGSESPADAESATEEPTQLGIASAGLILDGVELATERLRIGAGRGYGGGEVAANALDAGRFPPSTGKTGLRLWRGRRVLDVRQETDPETLERLKALGYIG